MPVVVGITHADYENVLFTTTPRERRERIWVFLDWELADIVGEDPEAMPFEFDEEASDVDERSGVRIVWGAMGQDFIEAWRVEMILGWLSDMRLNAQQYFDEF